MTSTEQILFHRVVGVTLSTLSSTFVDSVSSSDVVWSFLGREVADLRTSRSPFQNLYENSLLVFL